MENYETRTTHTWLANDEDTYRTCMGYVADCRDEAATCDQVHREIWTVEEATRFLLADRLKQFVHDGSPLGESGSLYADLLNAALSDVDWNGVANAFLDQ